MTALEWRTRHGERTRQRLARLLRSHGRAAAAAHAAHGAGALRRRGDRAQRGRSRLLRRGWRVLAIDAEPAAIARLQGRSDLPADATLETRCARFEDATWPTSDLINASFALPLCPPERFPEVWARIERSLATGGRFAGQLFGERDEWRGEPGITHHARAD